MTKRDERKSRYVAMTNNAHNPPAIHPTFDEIDGLQIISEHESRRLIKTIKDRYKIAEDTDHAPRSSDCDPQRHVKGLTTHAAKQGSPPLA